MAPNRRQHALMLQMNAVDRRTDERVRLLLTLEKFAPHRDRVTEPNGGVNGTAAPARVMSTKKDIAPYSLKPLIKQDLPKNEPKTNPFLIFKTTASSDIRKQSG
jgi:hypothetical protein